MGLRGPVRRVCLWGRPLRIGGWAGSPLRSKVSPKPSRTKGKPNSNWTNRGGGGGLRPPPAGGSDTQGLCHVTPSGYCESWRGPGGSGGTAGPGPDSGDHRRARAMVRAGGARASAAGVAVMLGPAVFRAAPRGPLHKSWVAQQQANVPRRTPPSSGQVHRRIAGWWQPGGPGHRGLSVSGGLRTHGCRTACRRSSDGDKL